MKRVAIAKMDLKFVLFFFSYIYACISTPQPNVLSDGKKSGLYIWIHLNDGTDLGSIMRKVWKFHHWVKELCPNHSCQSNDAENEHDEILAGIGFGTDFYNQATDTNRRNYTFTGRRGFHGEMPYTGGDIFVHAKSNSYSKLFELSQMIQKALPHGSVSEYRDVYGFEYRGGRDLSGFIDGTENPSRTRRINITVDPETNGSFCMTQEWIHHLGYIASESGSTLESFVGRKLQDSSELRNKSITSHVARMTTGPAFKANKSVEIYRQSMPYGTVGGDAGLFFIAYSSSTSNFDLLLNRMTGPSETDSDDIMRLSRCVSGNFWYFPSTEELEKLQNSNSAVAKSFRSNRPRKFLPSQILKESEQLISSAKQIQCISKIVIIDLVVVFVFRL